MKNHIFLTKSRDGKFCKKKFHHCWKCHLHKNLNCTGKKNSFFFTKKNRHFCKEFTTAHHQSLDDPHFNVCHPSYQHWNALIGPLGQGHHAHHQSLGDLPSWTRMVMMQLPGWQAVKKHLRIGDKDQKSPDDVMGMTEKKHLRNV